MPLAESTRHDSLGETRHTNQTEPWQASASRGTSWMNSAFAGTEHFRMDGTGQLFQGLDDSRAGAIQQVRGDFMKTLLLDGRKRVPAPPLLLLAARHRFHSPLGKINTSGSSFSTASILSFG